MVGCWRTSRRLRSKSLLGRLACVREEEEEEEEEDWMNMGLGNERK